METAGAGYTSRTRDRIAAVSNGNLASRTEVPGQKPVDSNQTYLVKVVGSQTTVSRDNQFLAKNDIKRQNGAHINSKRAISAIDIGGNFHTIDNQLSMSHKSVAVQVKTGYTTRTYRGPLFANGTGTVLQNTSTWPTISPPSTNDLNVLGTTAIKNSIPSPPGADLAVALAELCREGMPSFTDTKDLIDQLRRRKNASPIGEAHLDQQFGAAPILAEIRKFARCVLEGDKLMRQYDRDAGRQIRRRFVFPPQVETTLVSTTGGVGVYPTLPTPMYETLGHVGILSKVRTRRIETWFSGCFMYQVPYSVISGETVFARDVVRARKLLGIRLDIEVLWNLAPWSWFADWFVNIGQVISNIVAFSNDGLVMRYGYLMYKETIEDRYTHSGVSFYKQPGSGEIQTTFTTTLKKRVKAHPFGFGVRDVDLTPKQLSILAALGISLGRS